MRPSAKFVTPPTPALQSFLSLSPAVSVQLSQRHARALCCGKVLAPTTKQAWRRMS